MIVCAVDGGPLPPPLDAECPTVVRSLNTYLPAALSAVSQCGGSTQSAGFYLLWGRRPLVQYGRGNSAPLRPGAVSHAD